MRDMGATAADKPFVIKGVLIDLCLTLYIDNVKFHYIQTFNKVS